MKKNVCRTQGYLCQLFILYNQQSENKSVFTFEKGFVRVFVSFAFLSIRI